MMMIRMRTISWMRLIDGDVDVSALMPARRGCYCPNGYNDNLQGFNREAAEYQWDLSDSE